MASLTDERLAEMEAEMNRFEQEILVPKSEEEGGSGPRMIIGANTYNRVQAQIRSGVVITKGPIPSTERGHDSGGPSPAAPIPLSVLTPPPPPPPSHMSQPTPSVESANSSIPLLPPPPPPPPPLLRPLSFIPPQLQRHRAPPPPPPRPFMGPPYPPSHMMPHGPPRGPYMGGPGPMPPYMGGPQMPPNMMGYVNSGPMNPNTDGTAFKTAAQNVIEKPKVVYSAAPVRNVPTSKPDNTPKEPVNVIVESSKSSASVAVVQVGPELTEAPVVPQMEEPGGNMEEDGDGTHVPTKKEKKERKKKYIRTAAGQTWEDPTLTEWDTDDFRIFCGDLGNEVTDEHLARAFTKYTSFVKAKVIRDKKSNKTRGYGFVSFRDPNDFVRAMREMNGKYVGNRPIKLRKSNWKDRNIEIVRKKDKEKKRLGLR